MNEVYEQMEIDNSYKNLIHKKNNESLGVVLAIIILPLAFFIFCYGIKIRMDQYATNKKITLNYKIDYKKNKIRNYIAHRDFEALSISQFPSGNFIIHDEILAIIYDNNLYLI